MPRMGAHQGAVDRLMHQIATTRDLDVRDHLLEQLFDVTGRATEWDAMQWGFETEGPHAWMYVERREMDRRTRGRGHWPTEPLMRARTRAQEDQEVPVRFRCPVPAQAPHSRG